MMANEYYEIRTFTCRHCGITIAQNSTRMRKHLIDCDAFQKTKQSKKKDSQQPFPSPSTEMRVQTTLKPIPTSKDIHYHAELDRLAARVCYEDARPFTLFQSPAMQRFLHKLAPDWTPPSPFRIANDLLDAEYTRTHEQVSQVINEIPQWNIVIDGSSDTNHNRILNLIIHTVNGAFFWCQHTIGSTRASAEMISGWLIDQLKEITNDRFHFVNSLSTDTCNVNQSIYSILQKSQELS